MILLISSLWVYNFIQIVTGAPADSASLCDLSPELINEIANYKGKVNEIVDSFVHGPFKGRTYNLLAELTDTFGHRQAGFESLEKAIDWVVERSRRHGFDKVITEPVTVLKWARNEEYLEMIKPRRQRMVLTGLGRSVGTQPGSIYAEAVVVSSFNELKKVSHKIPGKIVVYNVPFTTYGETKPYRSYGSDEAAKFGAVAALVRSVTQFSIGSPHTGGMYYRNGSKKIPGAAITVEDAAMLKRMQDRGESIWLNLTMGAETLGDAPSRNTLIETRGTEVPEEIVVLSGHIDSWDVGTGAMDDAGGCIASMVAAEALNELNIPLRRTLRVVLFTAEEMGFYGANEYYRIHSNETYQMLLESDSGTFSPRGIGVLANNKTYCIMKHILSLMDTINATEINSNPTAPDLGKFKTKGVPVGGLSTANERYFWFHHSEGDRMEFVDSASLDRVSALWTSVAFVLGNLSILLPR